MPTIDFEGRPVELEDGDTVASALYRAGVRTFSRSFKNHRRRGLYCLSGDCPNCLVTVDGEPGVRSCTTPARAGQRVVREYGWPSPELDLLAVIDRLHRLFPVGFYYKVLVRPRRAWPLAERLVRRVTGLGSVPLDGLPSEREALHHHPDLLVVGGGVAGLSAALAAAEAGREVVLCDEGTLGEKVAPGPTRERIEELARRLRALDGVTVLERAAAVGVYEGPLVPVSGEDLLHLVHPARVVVATGAVERHAVFPGNDLVGVWLGRGAARLAGVHGVPPGRSAVVVTDGAEGLRHLETLRGAGVEIAAAAVPDQLAARVPGGVRVVRGGEVFAVEGRARVERALLGGPKGRESVRCDAVVLSLGPVPRDGLLRQAAGLPVGGAGEVVMPGCTLDEAAESGRAAALEGGRSPSGQAACPVPRGGFVCLCEDVEARDLEAAWSEGFRSTELLKRYTTATMGPCQGALCQAPLCAFVRARAGEGAVSATATARPPARPISLEEAAAGLRHHLELRTSLHERHLELGARMEWAGMWKRPESYGDPLAEYWAVRRGVSIMDVGTLGKFLLAGRDAAAFLERLYPCHVRDIEPGRLRYSLVLNEAGYVIDDGLICSLGSNAYYLTFTSGGAEQAEAWLRDWAETWALEVHLVNRTAAVGAINVAGPRARELLSRLTSKALDGDSFPYLHHREIEVAGVPCRAIRLGFVGELSYELHHPSSQSLRLWDGLLAAGAEMDIRPHGLEALRLLRLEKGHIIVGQDTDFDTTPSRLGLDWAVKLEKDYFIGKAALRRIAKLPLERKLVGLTFEGPDAPPDGTPLSVDGRHAGYLTSSRFSPALGRGIALAWLRRTNGEFPTEVEAGTKLGKVVSGAFYDPRGGKLRV